MKKAELLVAGAVLCATFCFNAEAKLYKWVDENGTTHYGETIPPEYAGRDTKELDKGRVTERNDKLETGKKKKPGAEEEVVDKATLEARRRDNALLNSYSNEKEIDLARDRNLSQVNARISSYTTLLKSAQASLDDLHKEEAKIKQQGRPIPASLTTDIAQTVERVSKLEQDLEMSKKDAEAVRARYEADKQRFRELKGTAPAGK